MSGSNRRLRANLVREFLTSRGWIQLSVNPRFVRLGLPSSGGADEQFSVIVPVDSAVEDNQAVLRRVTSTISQIYSVSSEQLEVLFSEPNVVLSIQIDDRDTAAGSIPLLRFESLVERLKKTLLDVTSFVITDLPTIKFIPDDAIRFLKRCHFLQTEYGSYVANVQLPSDYSLVPQTMFTESDVQSSVVSERLASVLGLVVGPVFERERDIYDDDFWRESADLINVDVLSDINEMFKRTAAQEMNFSFLGTRATKIIKSGPLTDAKFERLHRFITFAKERVDDLVDIEFVGKIVRLASRNPLQNRNHVALVGIYRDRETLLGVTLGREDYSTALRAHRQNQRVRVKGRAQRLKTQYSMTKLMSFEIVSD